MVTTAGESAKGAAAVIIGAGQAGGDLAGFLRQAGHTGSITLLGDEPYVPYRRPPLSKAFLAGEVSLDSLYLRPAAYYPERSIDFRVSTAATAIDRSAHRVLLANGSMLPYDKLVLATGGHPRRLALPGGDAANVHYVRTIEDILRLKEQFVAGRRLVIIGGGYIGLEAASVGIKKGLQVTVVEALPRVLARVTAPEMSAFYEGAHRKRGVDVRTGAGVQALEGVERVECVVLDDGSRVPADIVIVGIGLVPNTAIAESAGLEVFNGIVVDAYLRTSDLDIHAIGDCASYFDACAGRRVRIESVPNATEQARACAATLTGAPTPFSAVPWFWSDQFDLKLQMVGLSTGYDQMAIRGDMGRESFCAFYLHDGVLIAADAVNRPADFIAAKRLVASRARVSTAQLSDDGTPLKSLVPAATIP
jgi:3-phenylpropionate/trans-cinnamate dioxygenase ferredoxin reductase subunit